MTVPGRGALVGFDDGTVVHPLTAPDARAFFAGSNVVSTFSGGPGKTAVIHKEPATGARQMEQPTAG